MTDFLALALSGALIGGAVYVARLVILYVAGVLIDPPRWID